VTVSVEEFVDHFDFTHPDFPKLPPEFIWDVYRRLRAEAPVVRAENAFLQPGMVQKDADEWHVLGYAEVFEVLHDPQRFSSRVFGAATGLEGSIITLDPPEQPRDKKFITPFFSPGRMRTLEHAVRESVDREIDTFIDCGHGDLARVAWRVPGLILFRELLGFPIADVEPILDAMHPELGGQAVDLSDMELAVAMLAGLTAYCAEQLALRSEEAEADELNVFDHLLHTKIDGEDFPFDKIVANAVLLVAAGLETTSNALTNAYVWLASHPDERDRLVADPSMIPRAVEELVRFTGSVHGLGRVALEDTNLGGCPIKRGDYVTPNFAAANRDPREFHDPDECIIDRDPNRHLAFGAGTHRCVGSNLARLEMRVGIEQVLRRMPDIRIVDGEPPTYRHGLIPGHPQVPVRFTPGTRLHAVEGGRAEG
jgi:cytochrome P450